MEELVAKKKTSFYFGDCSGEQFLNVNIDLVGKLQSKFGYNVINSSHLKDPVEESINHPSAIQPKASR